MNGKEITFPELALIAATRAMLGAGLGLLLAGKLSEGQRKGAGWALFLAGVATTIPLAVGLLSRNHCCSAEERGEIEKPRKLNVPGAA